jgi:hypothetical protein
MRAENNVFTAIDNSAVGTELRYDGDTVELAKDVAFSDRPSDSGLMLTTQPSSMARVSASCQTRLNRASRPTCTTVKAPEVTSLTRLV